MANLLIRDVPEAIRAQIRRVQHRKLVSQNACLVALLSEAIQNQHGTTLFDERENGDYSVRARENFVSSYSVPFTFVDLFSGIGGMRLGLESVGGKCVFSCEIDPHAQKTYLAWFGENPAGDVTKLTGKGDIPPHDVLAAGFPCQPFSLAGVSKKRSLGREHGFKDRTQGTLFFHLATIIELHRPPILLLENVKNLRSHNQGNTWNTIAGTLDDLNYAVFHEVIDASSWVPQHRERVLIVGFDRKVFGNDPPFVFANKPNRPRPKLLEILEEMPDPKYTLSDHLWKYLQEYAERHRQKGNGFGCSVANPNGISRTLSARYYKDGSEILIPQGKGKNPRRLTPKEAGRLMGFPESVLERQVVSDMQAYKQFGNAVVPAVIESVAKEIVNVMHWKLLQKNGCLLKR